MGGTAQRLQGSLDHHWRVRQLPLLDTAFKRRQNHHSRVTHAMSTVGTDADQVSCRRARQVAHEGHFVQNLSCRKLLSLLSAPNLSSPLLIRDLAASDDKCLRPYLRPLRYFGFTLTILSRPTRWRPGREKRTSLRCESSFHQAMPAHVGSPCDSFGDIHYYYGSADVKPRHHRFDKGSYVYLFENANERRCRIEVANNAGSDDQDAFDGCKEHHWKPG